jgi:pyruvate dehydrogenase E2 component (dihydrolipoyllysine-residue acetyltransferase)
MAELTMPKMGDAMEEGTVLRWLKSEGDSIAEEEPIAEIQTEKATIEVPSYEAGKLTRILVSEGQTVPVGTPIAQYEPAGGNGRGAAPPAATADREQVPGASRPTLVTPGPPDAGGQREPGGAPPQAGRQAAGAAAPLAGEVVDGGRGASAPPASAREAGERVKATPLAKKVAAARGIDLAQVRGTGPGGRIVEADVEQAATQAPAERRAAPSARPAPAPGQKRPLSPMRRTIARRLTESKQNVPHFYVTMEIDMAAAAQFRQQLNALDAERPKLSFDVLIVKACAAALQKFPEVNSQYTDDGIVQPDGIHIGIAVALDDGLIVPVIRSADQKALTGLAAEAASLIEKARAGKLQPQEYSGGTFSITNLGMYGVTSFIAVINPPESAILAVGGIHEVPVVKDGQLTVGTRMQVTLSADHRAVDGAVAAQFLREVKRLLEAPLLLV